MRIDAIPIGVNPPHDVNVIIEVPVGGEPIKNGRGSRHAVVDRSSYGDALPRQLRVHPARCPATATLRRAGRHTRAIVPGAG
jgi:hypothetical protein